MTILAVLVTIIATSLLGHSADLVKFINAQFGTNMTGLGATVAAFVIAYIVDALSAIMSEKGGR